VVYLVPHAELGEPAEALRRFAALTLSCLPYEHARPVTLRLRLQDGASDPGRAETEVRFKVRIPRAVVAVGAGAVRRLSEAAVRGFERILGSAELARYMILD
jgi:ABC-type enterobactin transport system permease subunit